MGEEGEGGKWRRKIDGRGDRTFFFLQVYLDRSDLRCLRKKVKKLNI